MVVSIETGLDVDEVYLLHNDPFAYDRQNQGLFRGWPGIRVLLADKKRLKDKLWWTVTISPPYKRLKYCFELHGGGECLYFFEDGLLTEAQMLVKDRSRQYFIFPWMNKMDIAVTPAWVAETVWYQIFPERFCNGDKSLNHPDTKAWIPGKAVRNDELYGGDLPGIESKIGYLEELGVTGIYLTPINEAPSTHKYDTTDYLRIDPYFGTNDDFARLVKKAHEKNIRVMVDAVFNHSGPRFAPWLDVIEKGPQSEFFDWFMVDEWPFDFQKGAARNGQFMSFAFVDNMPKLNTNHAAVCEYLINVCCEWVKEYDIDGIRIDVANEVSHFFLRKLRERVKALKPDIYILGEVWHNAFPWLRGDEFDAVMNYPLAESIRDFWIDPSLTTYNLEATLNRCLTAYMRQMNDVSFNLLDSHDTKRLRTAAGSFDIFCQQLTILFLMPGSPCIYYGTEIAMMGESDPDCRRIMPWDEIESGVHDETIAFVRDLIRLRREETLFRSQDFHFHEEQFSQQNLSSQNENPRLVSFQKSDDSPSIIEVFINCGEAVNIPENNDKVLLARKYLDGTLATGGFLIRKR